jgi:ABC-2 type transport system permease protein
MGRIGHLIRKEFIQIFRDRAMLVIIFAMPLVQLLILGYAVTTDVKNIGIVFIDQDQSSLSREIREKFAASGYFTIKEITTDLRQARIHLDRGDAMLAVVFPIDFERTVKRREYPELQLLVNGQDANTSNIALGYAQGILKDWMMQELLSNLPRQIRMIQVESRVWYNPNLESQTFMIPGIMVVLLTMITALLSSLGLVREKEIGTLEQLLVTPLNSVQLIAGKIVPYAILGFVEVSLALLLTVFWFGISVMGSIFLFYGFVFLFVFTTLGLGIFISTISQTQQQALFFIWFFLVAALLLSGLFIPIENMPSSVQYITYLNPMRFMITVVREIFLKGAGILNLWREAVIVTAFGVLIFSAAIVRFRKRLV